MQKNILLLKKYSRSANSVMGEFAGKRLRKILFGLSLLGRYGSSEEHNDTFAYGKVRLHKCGLCW